MGQFDYLRDQISNNFWIGKEVLKIGDSVREGIEGGADWYFALPHIQFIMENTVMGNVKELLLASQDLAGTVVNCNLVFLETAYGVNKAFNSKIYKDLAGKGQTALSQLTITGQEKIIYEASVTAHNESLNLPELSVKVAEIEAQIATIQQSPQSGLQQMNVWKSEALNKLQELKNQLLGAIESLTGKDKTAAKRKLKIAEAGIAGMASYLAFLNLHNIIAQNPYEITSQYDRSILSIRQPPSVLNAIVPIAVGGAATVVGAATVITGIATWLLGSFFLKSIGGMATGLLSALANTTTSIVFKIMGGAGADAVRYLAASALKTNAAILPKIFGTTGMQASGWFLLMSHASPIIGAAVIIIQAMKNKLGLAELLYIFGDIKDSPNGRFQLTQAIMYDTNHAEILQQFKYSAKEMLAESKLPIEKIIGVGMDDKKKYRVGYNLTNPEKPERISSEVAIVEALGTNKIAKIASGDFFNLRS
jgi:hypothetical protein